MSENEGFLGLNQRREYFTRRVSEFLDSYPYGFEEFVENQEIIRYGDEILSRRLSSGYNVARLDQFPINSEESYIFYSVYSSRRGHFGELLARMER